MPRIANLPGGLVRRLRVLRWRFAGAKIGRRCWLRSIEIPRNAWDIELGESVALDCGVVLLSTGEKSSRRRISIGDHAYVNRHVMIDASQRIEIGRGCMIGPFCYITDHDHGMAADRSIATQPLASSRTRIEDGAWLGAHVTVLKGVTIGVGAVVGAGSVVTKDVPPNAIAAGVPARAIGQRE